MLHQPVLIGTLWLVLMLTALKAPGQQLRGSRIDRRLLSSA